MSNDIQKADQIAFHFYTKLFYVVNDARATEGPKSQTKVDKWFNLETPDSDLFTKEAREQYRNISQAPSYAPAPLEIQVVLSVPELTNNQVLVYMSSDSSRVRIEPTPNFIVLETWTLECVPHHAGYNEFNTNMDTALPIIYKHGIVLFRSIYSMLRVLPAWKFYKRLRRKMSGMNRNGNFGIHLRTNTSTTDQNDGQILKFHVPPSPHHRQPFPTSSHTFPSISHILGIFKLSTTYLDNPDFQLDDLESLLSSRFISLDREEFVPTLEKNRSRDSISGSSLPSSSGLKSLHSRSPPMPIARAPSAGGTVLPIVDSTSVAERFILPPAIGTSASTGTSALIPPPRPFPSMNPSATNLGANPSPSGLAFHRLRIESMNSSSSSLISLRDNIAAPSSLSSSPSTAPVPIRKPNIFKANTVSSASNSSPSLSIRQTVPSSLPRESPTGATSATSTGMGGGVHSRHPSYGSPIPNVARLPPSPIATGFTGVNVGTPSSFGDKRPGTSGSGADSDRDRRISMPAGFGATTEDGGIQHVGAMAVPSRKRYSSSFGHRYAGSGGSSSSIGVGVGSAASSGAVLPVAGAGGRQSPAREHTPGSPSGKKMPASVTESKKEDPISYLSTATDDDDISVFVQDIDARKPLSGRTRQLWTTDRLPEQDEGWNSKQGQGHDREDTVATVNTKAKETTPAPAIEFRRFAETPLTTYARERAISLPGHDLPSTAAAASSTSPPRGLMLTSKGEVDERLSKMKEVFLKSIEGLGSGNGVRRKEKDRKKSSPTTTTHSSSKTSSTATPFDRSSTNDSPHSPLVSNDDPPSLASRGMTLGFGFPSREQGSDTSPRAPYDYNAPSLGTGIGRARYASTSSSTLGNSDVVGTSQGSEEVIGRMDLYEERRRGGGYQG